LARHQRSVLEPRWECTLYRGDCSVAPLLLWLIPPPIFWIIQAFGQTSTFGNAPAFGQPSSFGGGGGAFGTSTGCVGFGSIAAQGTGAFGGAPSAPTAFGGSPAGGGFGAVAASGGGFGALAQQQGGGFSTQRTPPNTAFSAFRG